MSVLLSSKFLPWIVVVLAVAITVFVKYPQPEMDWEGQIYPAAQRYMEEYYRLAAAANSNNVSDDGTSGDEENTRSIVNVDPKYPLKGLVVAITGPTAGIGLALTRRLYKMGAHIIAIGRSSTKLQKLQDELMSDEDSSAGKISTVIADLSDLESVAKASTTILDTYDYIDILVNNAGVQTFPHGLVTIEQTKQGYDQVFGVNYLAHFLLTEKIKPLLGKSPGGGRGKIIQISSSYHGSVTGSDLIVSSTDPSSQQPIASIPGGHHGFFFFRCQRQYANSKFAQVLHMRALNRENRLPTNVRAVSICPTWVGSDILGQQGSTSNSLLSIMAFPVDGYGLSSIFTAMFYNSTNTDTTTTPTAGNEDGGNTSPKSDIDDYFVNTYLTKLYSDPPYPSWLSTAIPFMDMYATIAAFGYMMPFQRFTAWTGPIKSNYFTYDVDLQESLYEWSLQAVSSWL